MIKSKTIQKNKSAKQTEKVNHRLQEELDKGVELVKQSNAMITHLNKEVQKREDELTKLKKHWTHKLYKWFK